MRGGKIKILYVIPRLACAGTEKHLLNLANGLGENNFSVTICCLFEIKEANYNFKDAKFKTICLRRKNIYDLRIILDLYRLIKEQKYDIVHTYLFGFHYLGVIPAKIAGVAVTVSSRRELARWKRLHHHLLENLGNFFTDRVIACSEKAKEFALQTEKLSKDKIKTIYNGINLQEFHSGFKNPQILNEFGFSETDKIVGMVANFSAEKDHKILLEAIFRVRKIYPQIKCLLVGDGPLREDLEKKKIDLGLQEHVRFIGKRSDIAQILSILDFFIFTSDSEGLPNAILEAMACGLPIVSTNVGGIPEVVEDGKSGILLPPGDCDAIADVIMDLLRDKNLRKEMGRSGRVIVEEKFNLERMIKDYKSLYTALLRNN